MNPTTNHENQTTSQCSSCNLSFPLTTSFFYFNKTKQRFDACCKNCRNIQKQQQRRKPANDHYNWANALLNGIRRQPDYDERLTAAVLVNLLRLQENKCALTGLTLTVASTSDIMDAASYTNWKRALSNKARLLLPRLVAPLKGDRLYPGNCLIIADFMFDCYCYHGSVADILMHKLRTPIIYTYEQLIKERV